MGRPETVSLCLIVRNEEAHLAACLRPIAGLFHEIVVVDTGSRDRTRQIAAELGARVFEFAWCDDFSAARNESLRRATGDWVLWLDADDRLDPANVERLRACLAQLPPDNTALVMRCRSTSLNPAEPAAILDQVRLFRRGPEVRWQGRVHEQVLPSLERQGHRFVRADVEITHVGYQDEAAVRRKINRDVRLLHLDYLADPDDPATLYHLAACCVRLGDRRQALDYLHRSLAREPLSGTCLSGTCLCETLRRRAFAMLSDVLWGLGHTGPAIETTAQGLSVFPDDEELLLERAEYLSQCGDLCGAEQCLLRVLNTPPGTYFMVGVREGIRQWIAPRELAVVYLAAGRHGEAERLLRQVVADYPDQVFAWVHLGALLVSRQRWVELEAVLGRLGAAPGGAVYALVLEADALFSQGRLPPVRPLLDSAIAKAPQMIWPRRLLGRWLEATQAGLEQRIAAQRDILRIAPGDFRARERLAALEQALNPDRSVLPARA